MAKSATLRRTRNLWSPGLTTFFLTFCQPAITATLMSTEKPIKAATKAHPYIPAREPQPKSSSLSESSIAISSSMQCIEGLYIAALVMAGQCRSHMAQGFSKCLVTKHRLSLHAAKGYKNGTLANARGFHYSSRHELRRDRPTRGSIHRLSKQECLALLDYYTDDQLNPSNSKYLASFSPTKSFSTGAKLDATPSNILTDPKQLDLRSFPINGVHNSTEGSIADQPSVDLHTDVQTTLQDLLKTLAQPDCTHEEAWAVYCKLPSSSLLQLDKSVSDRLLQCLSIIPKKTTQSMLRYLSVLETMRAFNIPTSEGQWNSAIAFTARAFGFSVGSDGMQAALIKWREMEVDGEVTSGFVTFNILFDLATKAGKFALAEMIMREMNSRNLPLTRFGRVGLIYYHGLRGDGDAVRNAYREFVEAGEVVDTVTLNCVIASLLRAGETAAAEQTYQRMKSLACQDDRNRNSLISAASRISNDRSWLEIRSLGRLLDRLSRKKACDRLALLQARQTLLPDATTFRVLIEHHAKTTGELGQITNYLTDMDALSVSLDGPIFVKILTGFHRFGGQAYSMWSSERLESVWYSLASMLDRPHTCEVIKMERWLAVWLVRAFARCSGQRRANQVWKDVQQRWQGSIPDLLIVKDMVASDLDISLSDHSQGPLTDRAEDEVAHTEEHGRRPLF